MIEDINTETVYHSFIICQTNNKELAQKWPYFILSSSGEIHMGLEEYGTNHQYNYSVDSISYDINSTNLILGQGNWFKETLNADERHLLKKHKVLRYDTLSLSNQIHYYFHMSGLYGDRFLEIKPNYLHDEDCLIFQAPNFPLSFKKVSNEDILKIKNIRSSEIFNFHSQYAMLSDIHFRNCFVRGKKEIGSYVRDQKYYILWINTDLFEVISALYPLPKF